MHDIADKITGFITGMTAGIITIRNSDMPIPSSFEPNSFDGVIIHSSCKSEKDEIEIEFQLGSSIPLASKVEDTLNTITIKLGNNGYSMSNSRGVKRNISLSTTEGLKTQIAIVVSSFNDLFELIVKEQ